VTLLGIVEGVERKAKKVILDRVSKVLNYIL
jgi:hypothetical protein